MRFGLPRLAALLLALTAAGCDRWPGAGRHPANLLLITVDTLRADHLSTYGYPLPTSPTVDRLAREGVRFDRAVAQWPKTAPSFASLFTATYPRDNGIVRRVGMPLPRAFRMLAEELRGLGYTTHAVVANGAVASDFHFDQGFDTYVESWKLEDRQGRDPNGAEAVNDLARAVIAGIDRGRPYFLWVHYLDPHFPYAPPPPWSGRFQGEDHYRSLGKLLVDPDKPAKQLGGIGRDQVLGNSDELAFYVARYDAEIAYADAQLAELLAHLDGEGLMRRTLTVFTSDHGESLGEHAYYFDHGRFSFQTCLRVPLIFHYPGVLPAGVVDADPVELIHLAPTMLEAAGAPLDGGRWMQGRSLMPRMRGEEAPSERPPYAFSEAGYATLDRWQKVVQDRRYKLIYAPYHPDRRWISGRRDAWFALFDLEQDPAESVNLIDEQPAEVARLNDVLVAWLTREEFDALVEAGEPEEAEGEMSEETRRQLKALGYLQ